MSSLQIKKLPEKILLWGFAGPILLTLTLSVAFAKAPDLVGISVALALVAGVFSCWKWKARGLVLASGLLLGSSLFLSQGDASEVGVLWYTFLLLSFLLGLFVTSLCFHEASYLVNKSEEDSARYLEDYMRLEESLKEQDDAFQNEKRALVQQLTELENYAKAQKEEVKSNRGLLVAVRTELQDAEYREKELKRSILQLRERLANMTQESPKESSERESQFIVSREQFSKESPESQKSLLVPVQKMLSSLHTQPIAYGLPALGGRVATLLKVGEESSHATSDKVETLRQGLEFFQERSMQLVQEWVKKVVAQEKSQQAAGDLAKKAEEVHKAWEEVAHLKQKSEEDQRKLELLSDEKERLEAALAELRQIAKEKEEAQELAKKRLEELNTLRTESFAKQDHLMTEESSKKLEFFHRSSTFLSDEVKRLKRTNDLYKQLRKQFEEKTEVLDRTREEMFNLETKLLVKEIDSSEHSFSQQVELETLRREMANAFEDNARMEQEISSLHELVSTLSAAKEG